jgi:hypothetical protein
MARYKLLFIEDSQLRLAVPLEAADDGDALKHVAERRFGRPCELWRADQLVGRFADERSDNP